MSNSICLKFDWDSIIKREKWIIDFSQLKEQILEKVYSPKGWEVVVGKTSNDLALTLLDEEAVYYTLYGNFNIEENCIVINKVDYIFMPNCVKRETVRLVFVATQSKDSLLDQQLFAAYTEPPVDHRLIEKQYTSFLKNQLTNQLKPLKVKEIKRNHNVRRMVIQIHSMPFIWTENSYDSYALYRFDQKIMLSLELLTEKALEIGRIESWDLEKQQIVVTFAEDQYLPTQKELKQSQLLLINSRLLGQLQKLKLQTEPRMVYSTKSKLDYRSDIKQSIKEVLDAYQVQPTWSSSTQFFYYENEAVKDSTMKAIAQRIIDNKRPVTAIAEGQMAAFLTDKGHIEKPFNATQLKQHVESLSEMQQQLERNEQLTKATSKKINKLTEEISHLQIEVSTIDEERKAYYDKVDDEKQQLKEVQQQKEIIESQLSELASTKSFLTISSEELKEQLRLKINEEKQLKKSIESVYLHLNEFKKSEQHYETIFKLSSQQTEMKLSLNQLEKRLKQYKQLNQTVDQSLETVNQFIQSSVEDQVKNLEKLMTVDMTLKVTTQIEEIKAMQAQLNEQLEMVGNHTVYFNQLQYEYDTVSQKLLEANIQPKTDGIQALRVEKNDLTYFKNQIVYLLDHPPNRFLGSLFRNKVNEWQNTLSNCFNQFVGGYKYWQSVALSVEAQKGSIQKQAQVQLHRYALAVKNGLHERKHATINQFMRNTEIDISKIYLEMFKLNRQREEMKANLKYFDESLDAQGFKNQKSDLQLQLTGFISTIRQLTETIEENRREMADYGEKLTQLEQEMEQQEVELNDVTSSFEQAERKYERIYSKYKNILDQTNLKLEAFEAKTKQLEQLHDEQHRLAEIEEQTQELIYLPVLQNLLTKEKELSQSISCLNVTTPDAIGNVAGITIIENVQQLSPSALKQIAQQADYWIGFVPVQFNRLQAPMLKSLENKKRLPILLHNYQFYDECAVALLQYFYSNTFEFIKHTHEISTQHIRNNHYITWIVQDHKDPLQSIETQLSELHEQRKMLLEAQAVDSKLRVKLFSDSGLTQEQIFKSIKGYSLRFHKLKFLKQHEDSEDLQIVHFSDSTENIEENIHHLKALLLAKKPVVIITSAAYLKQQQLQTVDQLLSQFNRIKESGREKQWATAIKRKV